jgi:5'(3')-deoxyribonucleotidase
LFQIESGDMKNNEPIILLDMDGVLANFVSASITAAHLPIAEEDVVDWDYYKPFCTLNQFWQRIGTLPYFWIKLEKYEWADELFKMCSLMAKTVIATSPSRCSACPSEKVNWLREQGYLTADSTDYMLGPHKELMARENTILIDDSDRNIEAFRAAGGRAITFPQKWNVNRNVTRSRLDYVEAMLQLHVGQIITG